MVMIPAVCTYNVHMMDFIWDQEKADSNQKKHGISFSEAKSVYYDEFSIQFFGSLMMRILS